MIFIVPADEGLVETGKLEAAIWEKIKAKMKGARNDSIRDRKAGGLIISTSDPNMANVIKDIGLKEAKLPNPRILVMDVPSSYDTEIVMTCLKEQNAT